MRTPLCVLLSCSLAAAPWTLAEAQAARETEAEPERRLAALPLRVAGQADEATRKAWTEGLRRGLSRGSFGVVEQADVDAIGDASCDRQGCWDRIRSTGATHFVRTAVELKNRDVAVALDLVDAKSGKVLVSTGDTCEICGVEEVVNLLDSQGALLQTRLAAMGKGSPVLVIATDPPGALVSIDGEVVGTTPLERAVLEGAHKVRVSLNGYVAEERSLTLVPGVREQVALDLQRTPGNPKTRVLGAVALGGGVALLGGGIALLALDDVEYKPRCEGINIDADGDCRYLYNTAWGGAAMAISGAVLVTLGIVALVRNRGPVRPAKQARVLPTGLGLQARF